MWRATIKGVLARKVRLALTALAVVLGVAFTSGVYVLTDTLKASFDTLFAQTAVGSDLVVRTRSSFADDQGQRQRMPAGIVRNIRAIPGVQDAEGVLQGDVKFVEKDGRTAIQNGGAPTFGISWPGAHEVGPLRIVAGRPPAEAGEVAMDAGTLSRNGFHIGERVKVLPTVGAAQRYRIVGTFGLGDRSDFGGVTFAAFDPKTAEKVFGAPGLVDYVNVVVQPGLPVRQVQSAITRELGPGYEAVRSQAVAQEIQKPINEFLGLLNNALLGFAGVGLLVGGFIIFNTFTILVSQRTRELGLLRAMGASGTQVVGSVIVEAAVMGAFASALGLALGIGLANLLFELLPQFGLEVPTGDLVVLGRTVVAAGIVGIGVTVAAAVYPAFRAARIPPVAAIGDLRTSTTNAPLVWRTVFGVVVMLAGLGIGAWGVYGDLQLEWGVAVAFIGVFVVFLGVVFVGPVVARPLSRVLGAPLPTVLGVTGRLARGNAMRNPRRTSATAAALVVGLGLVSLVAIFADSAKSSIRHALDDGVRADFVLSSEQLANFSPAAANRIRKLPDVDALVSIRFGETRVQGRQEWMTGVDPRGLEKVVNLDILSGGTRGLAQGGIMLTRHESDFYKAKVGDQLVVQFPRGTQSLPVVGVYANRQFTGGFPVNFMISLGTFREMFGGTQQDTMIFVKAKPGTEAALERAMDARLREPFPNVTVRTRGEYRDAQIAQLDTFLNVFIALLFLSEIIAVLGIVNTLMLSVYERTRELGLLRAVGMSRRQVRRMVRGESVIIAFIGCALGILIGLLWGWAVTRALEGQGINRFSVPPDDLVMFVIASALAGFVAALLPAWHASRLDVLEAIAHE
jgi:putative ABC transport system permease protein